MWEKLLYGGKTEMITLFCYWVSSHYKKEFVFWFFTFIIDVFLIEAIKDSMKCM